jgi:hypothetical protein
MFPARQIMVSCKARVSCSFKFGLVSPIPPIAKLLRDPTVRALYVWLPSWLRHPLKAWGAVAKVRHGVLRFPARLRSEVPTRSRLSARLMQLPGGCVCSYSVGRCLLCRAVSSTV